MSEHRVGDTVVIRDYQGFNPRTRKGATALFINENV